MKKRNLALAFNFDGQELICATCFEHECSCSEYAALLQATTQCLAVHGSDLCSRCKQPYLRAETEAAAKRLSNIGNSQIKLVPHL